MNAPQAALTILSRQDETEVTLTAGRAGELAGSVKKLVIADQGTRELAANLRSQIKAVQKAAKATYIAITKPHTDLVAMVKEKFEPINVALEEALDDIDRKIVADQKEQRRIADDLRRKAEDNARQARETVEAEARKKREEEAAAVARQAEQDALAAGMSKADATEMAALEKADVDAKPIEVGPVPVAAYVPPPAKTVRTPVADFSVAEVWDYELEDLSKVPPVFVRRELDRGRVRTAVNDGLREIPGIRIFQKPRVSGS